MTDPAPTSRRLNWGCGTQPEAGWLNSDIKQAPGIDINADILVGLPLETGTIDYAVSIHALPELSPPDLPAALRELCRVLRPDGVLRLALPDLERAIDAYRNRDVSYFLVPDDSARSLGGKLVTQLTWYGYSRSLFTFDFTEELLYGAGFRLVTRCTYQRTAHGPAEITELDDRERESLFVEAVK